MGMTKYRTKVEKLGFPAGTPVSFEEDKPEKNTGKTGMMLCMVPNGGSLFYDKSELERVE